MRIIAVTMGSYPEGEATTNRVLSILKGLTEQGCEIDLLILTPTRKIIKGRRERSGIVSGVKFHYISKDIYFSGKNVRWLFSVLVSVVKTIYNLSKLYRRNKIDCVFILMNEPLLILPFVIYGKIKKIKLYHEQTETPEITYGNRLYDRVMFRFYILLLNKMNGIYVISTYLKNYFLKYLEHNRICVVNMTVDYTRFDEKNNSIYDFEYIAYCGTMYGTKDGVTDLISAFSYIKDKTNIKLLLIGDNTDTRAAYVKEKIKKLSLEERVIMTGSVESRQIPRYLKNAHLLVLSRPDNIQSRAGFPTKLGEYLLCEKPVIITDVGDISLFFKDGENVFLAKPGNAMEFASKMLNILNNYENAINVSIKGRQTAMKHFNYKIESKKLLEFIQTT